MRKLVPQSDLNCFTGPWMEMNRRNALMKLEDSIDSITSMCMALTLIQLKMTAHRVLLAQPPQPGDNESVHPHASKSSKGSSKSSASLAAVNARARAEAARARAAYAQKEIELRVKQEEHRVEETRLEATLEALHQERDAEAALAEANVYEAVASEIEEDRISVRFPQTFHPKKKNAQVSI
ncbi:hypothetical protein KUCAC02_000118 [Chaenocephalus aceratus]|nr:hypothetical protein KUCAC02_000118 [Chaenocephalus aceratus]